MTTKKELLFKVENLQKYFPIKKTSMFQKEQFYVKANKDVSLEIFKNETLGIVGESGCGKSTFGRTLIQLYESTGGSVVYYGTTLETYVPEYVFKTIRAIPRTYATYHSDLQSLYEAQSAVETAEESSYNSVNDAYISKRHAFNRKYNNMLRLAGGLVLYPNLNEVASVLTEQYKLRKEIAKLISDRDLLVAQDDADVANKRTSENAERIKRLNEKIEALTPGVEASIEKVEALRDTVRNESEFEAFESQRDNGIDLTFLTPAEMRGFRKDLQIIFQDPYSSLDPRFTVGQIIGEGLLAHKVFNKPNTPEYNDYITDIMGKSGLHADFIHRYPHQFSGGQRQRIGIARALALKPKFIVADEAVSALDVSIQAQVLKLLQQLKDENDLTYLFITHDLGVVKYISDRIGVMYFGHLVEIGPVEQIFSNPQHPYTKQLLAAIPRTDESKKIQSELDAYYAAQRGNIDYSSIFDFGFNETGEVDRDWYQVTEGHYVACRLKEGKGA